MPTEAEQRRFAVAALAVGSVGAGGPASELGVMVEGRWRWTARLSARFAVAGAEGHVAAASVDLRIGELAAGAALRVWQRDRLALDVRGDVLAAYVSAARAGATTNATRTAWAPAADLALEAVGRVARPFSTVLGAGAEVTLGTTAFTVNGVAVAHLAPVRLLGFVGIRVDF